MSEAAAQVANVDANKDAFAPGIGDRAVAVIQKLRAKQAPAVANVARPGGVGTVGTRVRMYEGTRGRVYVAPQMHRRICVADLA